MAGPARGATTQPGLGDWTVSDAVFPNGLEPLIEEVHGLGMQFGLWVEPEMVNPDSDLFRGHPGLSNRLDAAARTAQRAQPTLHLYGDRSRWKCRLAGKRVRSDDFWGSDERVWQAGRQPNAALAPDGVIQAQT
jgi:hypothetical protein